MILSQRISCVQSVHTFSVRSNTLCHQCALLKSAFSRFVLFATMNNRQGNLNRGPPMWKEKQKFNGSSSSEAQALLDKFGSLHLTDRSLKPENSVSGIQFGSVSTMHDALQGNAKNVWLCKAHLSTAAEAETEKPPKENGVETVDVASVAKANAELNRLLRVPLGTNFAVDNFTFTQSQIRATFYPKFENEKSDQEVRLRMIEMVSNGQATVEVSLKHSGSLFMYAGHEGGAYAKNSFGNIYTAVGVFVLGQMFQEAWGKEEARRKQKEFNQFLERSHMCISMELVTAVLGDHGQRPLQDYVVVTAVTELGNGKPKFYSTPELIAFCRKWRLPTNHVWLFSTRKSVSSFFAAYDALCEEGTATPVCKALNEVADVSVPGSKDHIKVQGEILEGLVARIVSRESFRQMEKVIRDFPPPPVEGEAEELGPSLRQICAANRSDEKQQIKALLESVGPSMCPDFSDWFGFGSGNSYSKSTDRSIVLKFLQAQPVDLATMKLQEMIRLMRLKHYPAAFKTYLNYHKIGSLSHNDLYFKMVIHVHSDSGFRRYQKEMREDASLWPLYRGFFVDVNLFKVNKQEVGELHRQNNLLLMKHSNGNHNSSAKGREDLADEDANLMVKLKFLTYKLRTFLIRNGLSTLFKEGPAAYRAYYLRQMRNWGTTQGKQRELSKMLDEWASYISKKYGNRPFLDSVYLSEAEPFLERYARRSPQNQVLVGSAGSLVRSEDFVALVESGMDEEGDLDREGNLRQNTSVTSTVPKEEGLIVFFPGIPGCAKSALCKEIQSSPGGLGDGRPVHSLMGDMIKGRYWPMIGIERRKRPCSITLADKNAPNEEVWKQIEEMCRSTRALAVPVVPESEGTSSNPFSLEALAVFIFRVLQRVNHPGNLDRDSPNAGYVLLMFYHLYEGKNRAEFESELSERFGPVVKMPLLKNDRKPMPNSIRMILEEGIKLYRLHSSRHGRAEPGKGTYAKEWAHWEKQLREVLLGNAEYLNSIQVPFDFAVKKVMEQLRSVAQGDCKTAVSSEKRKFGNIVYCAVSLPVAVISGLLEKMKRSNTKAKDFLSDKDFEKNLKNAHVTLAHKKSHGVSAVASYGMLLHKEVPVSLTALLFCNMMAAFEAQLGSVDGEQIASCNEWPHVTIWTAEGVAPKEANRLPTLFSEVKASRVVINPPFRVNGVLEFF